MICLTIALLSCFCLFPVYGRMFWKVVGQMNNSQRQQLLYFATGSSALPLQGEGTTSKISLVLKYSLY